MSKIYYEEIFSTSLNRNVELSIYIPDKYSIDTEVIYMHDGNNAFKDEDASFGVAWKIDKVIEDLNKKGELEEKVIIGFGCNHNNEGLERLREYSLWDNEQILKRKDFNKYSEEYLGVLKARGQKHIDFLIEELFDYVENKYNLGQNRSILGSSMGGLMSLTLILKHPDYFKKSYCVSNAFWYAQEGIVGLINTSEVSSCLIYLDVGTNEGSLNIENINKEYVTTNIEVYELLRDKGFNVVFNIFEGEEHNEKSWHDRLDIILKQEKIGDIDVIS